MVPYPKKINTGKDVIVWFADYFKDKFGYNLPKQEWGKAAGFVNYMRKQGYSLEDIAIVVWGKCNTSNKVKSIWYCKNDFDKLDYYSKLKNKAENKKEVKPKKYVKVDEEDDDKEGFFDELY